MKIIVNKESEIPIRDQLIEQISLQIASGTLKGKEKLPSIRPWRSARHSLQHGHSGL